jgi:hypothetical protein
LKKSCRRGQRAADHRYDCRRSVENVSSSEAKKSIPGIDQPVLAAVVCGEALAMRCAVVLDREPSVGIVEVGACQEETEIIAKGNLALLTFQVGQLVEGRQRAASHEHVG